MLMVRDFSNRFQELSGMPVSQADTKKKLKQAGIDVDSKQYKAVISSMEGASRGVGYTNIQAIRNRMSRYDKDGDYISPVTGMAGLVITDKNVANKNKITSIPESSRDEMFELTKREFIQENGIGNGDTTKRTDVYINMYRKMDKNDRLAAGNTLRQYERAYTQAFVNAIKTVDPKWEVGKPIPSGVLDNIKRENVEALMSTSGNSVGIDMKI
jgi:hypothetical protein